MLNVQDWSYADNLCSEFYSNVIDLDIIVFNMWKPYS
jgi:hypothetical protein